MMSKKCINALMFLFVCLFFNAVAFCEGSMRSAQQKINDFYLFNYKEDGSHDWEVEGKVAFIYDECIEIEVMRGKYYASEDIILVSSQEARLDKKNFDVLLRKDVHIENKDGRELNTDSLSWSRSQNKIQTDDWVDIKSEKMQINAQGLDADTDLMKANFKQNVEVKFSGEDGRITIVNCDGPLEIMYNDGRAIFYNNVVVEDGKGKLFADKATLFFDNDEKEMVKVVTEGNVKIVKDKNVTVAKKATYIRKEGKMLLEGRPHLVYYLDDNEESDDFTLIQ